VVATSDYGDACAGEGLVTVVGGAGLSAMPIIAGFGLA
jgi:hypothetical protein